jgi:uncharacterized protein
MITDPLFYLFAIPAVFLMGLSKGGFAGIGMIGLPIMALAISPVQAAAIILPILMIQDVFSVWNYRKEWDAKNLKVLVPSAALGILIGYLLASRVSAQSVSLVVGLISVVFAANQLIASRRKTPPAPSKFNRLYGVFCGALAGFTSMIVHAGSPPFQMFVTPQRLSRDIFVGTSVLFFATINWIKVLPYFALGQFSSANLTTSLVLFPLAIASTFAGIWLVRRVSGDRFYTIINLLLLLIGLKLIWDGLRAVFGG